MSSAARANSKLDATRKPVGDGAICPLRNSKFAEFIVEVFGRMPPHAANVRVPHIQVLSLKLAQIRRNPQPLATCDFKKTVDTCSRGSAPAIRAADTGGAASTLVQQPVASDLEAQGLGRALSMSERGQLTQLSP